MVISVKNSIKIVDESKGREKIFQLYVDNCRRAVVKQRINGSVTFIWQIAGPIQWQESSNILLGLLELSVIANQLQYGAKNDKKKK